MTMGIAMDRADMRPLEDRRREVEAELLAVRPDAVGRKIIDLLAENAARESLKNVVLGITMGRDLWEKFWRVHCDTVERDMGALFSRQRSPPAPSPSSEEKSTMSMYGVVLQQLRSTDPTGKTAAQLATTLNVPVTAVQDELDIGVRNGQFTNTAGTYTITSGHKDS